MDGYLYQLGSMHVTGSSSLYFQGGKSYNGVIEASFENT